MVLRGQPRIGYSTGMTTPQMVACLVLIPPKILKPPRRQFGILHRMLDVTMAQEELDRPRILLVVGQLIAAPMPELMRMHREPSPARSPAWAIILRTLESVSGPLRSERNT